MVGLRRDGERVHFSRRTYVHSLDQRTRRMLLAHRLLSGRYCRIVYRLITTVKRLTGEYLPLYTAYVRLGQGSDPFATGHALSRVIKSRV